MTRDYDEEEQGYDSEKERGAKDSDDSGSSPARYEGDGEGDSASAKHTPKQTKQNGDDHHDEQDMDVSDWDPHWDPVDFWSFEDLISPRGCVSSLILLIITFEFNVTG